MEKEFKIDDVLFYLHYFLSSIDTSYLDNDILLIFNNLKNKINDKLFSQICNENIDILDFWLTFHYKI